MSKTRVMALTVAALVVWVGSAQANETFEGKKGIGYAEAIGGPAGLAFNFGMGNLAVEGILGIKRVAPDGGDAVNTIGLGAGAHFAVLRSENAAFTAGGRLAIGLGKDATGEESLTQINIDIPMRVYWFADKHFSFHFEGGISIVMNPEKGDVFTNTGSAGPKGMVVNIFTGGGAFGGVGGTFWW